MNHTNPGNSARRVAAIAHEVTELCAQLRAMVDRTGHQGEFLAVAPDAAALLAQIESLVARERLAITPLPERAGREHEARQRKGCAA